MISYLQKSLLTVLLTLIVSMSGDQSLVSSLQNLNTALANLSGALSPKKQQKLSVIVSIAQGKWLDTNALQNALNSLNIPHVPTTAIAPKKTWHMTLATLHIPLPANVDVTMFEQQVKNDVQVMLKQAIGLNSYSLPFVQFEVWNRFYVATYQPNPILNTVLKDFLQLVQNKYPGTIELYPDFKPHISLIKFDVDKNNPKTANELAAIAQEFKAYDKRQPTTAVSPITINSTTPLSVPKAFIVQE